eukprot:XP_015581708.1 disease resistance-like protein DSC1 [Ricinus communis]
MASSSSSSTTHQAKIYDVFISFRGADVRDGFLSHLHQSLDRNQVNAFVDEKLKRGKEITSSLLEIIEKSYVSIVIFSKNYADSPWCLDELVKIFECYKKMKQIVVPVFYRVDPSHVQELTGNYGDVRPDSRLIREIVSHVLEELDHLTPSDVCEDGLFGIDSRSKDVRSLLCLESTDVQVIGIWGMGGIGKTTIVYKLFSQIHKQFPRQCFVADVREKFENSTKCSLQSEILYGLLGKDNLNTGMPMKLNSSVRRRLSQEKVLIVLDDVSDLDQIEYVVGSHVIYGSGSRIIITSRDRQLLKNVGAKVYEVKKLNHFEALHLFNLHAFKQNPPKKEYMELLRMAINYAQGIPLALKVLGSNLYGKSVEEWEDELEKLKVSSDTKVKKILRISYDGLDEKQKEIFLDIACFFKGYDKDIVTNVLNGCGFFAKSGISHLIDKSLVTISRDNKLGMHDLLQTMGKDIVSEEKELGRRTRLWNSEDVYKVLAKDMGTKSVEGMLLNMSQIRYIHLSSTAFEKLCNLRVLKFYEKNYFKKNKVLLPEGLEYFPEELRFLHWDQYPLKCLPLQFRLENLVELHMPKSQIRQFWTEDQTFGNLKLIDLRNSTELISIPDLSRVPNLEVLYLHGCVSLLEIPLSIQYLSKLTRLILSGCKSLRKLPSCLPLNIKELHLRGTAIEELPSSIGSLSKLFELVSLPALRLESLPSSIGQLTCLRKISIIGCSKLASLPDTICNLKSLKELALINCVLLNELPEDLGYLDSLEELSVISSGIRSLPLSVNQLMQLRYLNCSRCKGLLLPPLTDLPCLKRVRLSDCRMLEFPESLCSLETVEELYLDGNDFEIIPASIKGLSGLSLLDIRNCKRLKYLQELPSSLDDLYARNCTSLESVSTSFLLTAVTERRWLGIIDFSNCINLNEEACSKIMDDVLVTHQDNYGVIALYITGSEVLQRMRYQNNSGSSLSFRLGRHDLIGLSFCVVVASKEYPRRGLFDIRCTANFSDDIGHSRNEDFYLFGDEGREMDFQSENVFLWRDPIFDFTSRFRFNKASLQFFLKFSTNEVMIMKCGVHPIYNQDKRRKDDEDEEGDEMDIEEEPPRKRLKESEEQVNELVLKLAKCLLRNENEEEVQQRKESRELNCSDLSASFRLLLMVNTCLATSSQDRPHPTQILFTLMMLTVCMNLLSFVSSLSLHGFAFSL